MEKMDDKTFDLKVKYDKLFDKLFFSRDFRIKMTEKFSYCPRGITFDTCLNEKTGNIYFNACCKDYGYEYHSWDRVVGDYSVRCGVNDEMFNYMMEYLYDHLDKEMIDELNTYEGFIN